MVGVRGFEPPALPPEGRTLPDQVLETLNLSGSDSTQVDLKGLERTGMDPRSAHFQHTKSTEISDLLTRCN